MEIRLLIQGFFLLAWTSLAWAKPELEVNLEPSRRLKIGQIGTLTVDLKWRQTEGEYLFTKPEFSLEGLKIEEVGESNEIFRKSGEAWSRKTFRFQLKPLQPGIAEISPLRIKFLAAGDSSGEYLEAGGQKIKIVPDRSNFYWGMGMAASVLALGGVLLALFLRRRVAKELKGEPELSLEDKFIASLNKVSKDNDVLKGGKIFCSYLTQKYDLGTTPITIEEMINRLQGKLDVGEAKALKIILEKLNELRYAKNCCASEALDLYREMLRFIEGKKVIGI